MEKKIGLYPIKKRELNYCATISPNILQIGAVNKWEKRITGKNVVISVIDTGVDDTHPNLTGKIISGYNFTSEHDGQSSVYLDTNGHGTHVAGIIVGNGFIGVAPDSKIIALKVLNENGTGKIDDVIKAIDYSINWRGLAGEKVDVINLSLGIKRSNKGLENAVKRAKKANIPIVAASGNSGDGNIHTKEYSYPGYYNEVIEVGAVDTHNNITDFTNTNEEMDILAPGENIHSTYLNKEFLSLSGTSMAAPHVTGAIALIIEEALINKIDPLNESKILSILCRHTKKIGLGNDIEGCGVLYL